MINDYGKRVLVVGNIGAGKSTIASKISKETKLPLIHLDQHYWKPGWVRPSKSEWMRAVDELTSKKKWIIDGNYGSTMKLRLERADSCVFLDVNRFTCLCRHFKRRFKRNRVDPIPGCSERVSFGSIIRVLYGYPKKHKVLKALLVDFESSGGKVIHIK